MPCSSSETWEAGSSWVGSGAVTARFPSRSATCATSLSPRPLRQTSTESFRDHRPRARFTQARACAVSSAGMIPSSRESSWKASSASRPWRTRRSPGRYPEVAVLRPHTGIVQAGGDGVGGRYLPIGVLEQVAQAPVEYTRASPPQGGAVMAAGDPLTRGFNPDQADLRILQKSAEDAHRVRAAADARHHGMGQPAVPGEDLARLPCR